MGPVEFLLTEGVVRWGRFYGEVVGSPDPLRPTAAIVKEATYEGYGPGMARDAYPKVRRHG